MPSLQNILASNEKKLDITEYCKDILDQEEIEAWITIKKMPKELKRKLSILSAEKISKKAGKEMLKGIKEQGLTLDQVKNYKDLNPEDSEKILNIFLDADINLEEKKKIDEYQNEIEKIIFSQCVDKTKHNFMDKDKNNEKIDISNYDFWNSLGKDNLILFIMDEIQKFSEDFFFKKNGETK